MNAPCEFHTAAMSEVVKSLTKLSEEKDRLEIDMNDKISSIIKRVQQLEKHLPKECV